MYFSVRQGGTIVNALLQPQISDTALNQAVNITNPRGVRYTVLATSESGQFDDTRLYADQFYLDLTGLVPAYVTSELKPILQSSWKDQIKCKFLFVSDCSTLSCPAGSAVDTLLSLMPCSISTWG